MLSCHRRNALTIALASALFMPLAITSQSTTHSAPGSSPDGNREGRRNGRMVRGSVTAISTNAVTLKTDAGEVWTVQSTENTRFIKDQQPIRQAQIKPGDEVVAFGLPDTSTHQIHALMVGVVDAAVAAKARADMGKTYILGRISAINDTRLTVVRPDRVSQIINVDETTSFHRGGRMNLEGLGFGSILGGVDGGGGGKRHEGASTDARADENGESITLADIKVGDNIGATGSLKAGLFVPTDLRIQPHRQRGDGPGSSGGDLAPGPQSPGPQSPGPQ